MASIVVTPPMVLGLLVLGLWVTGPLVTGRLVADEAPINEAPIHVVNSTDAATVQSWVDDLSNESYLRRKRATRELIDAGSMAVRPLIKALDAGDLETTQRAMMVLQEIAVSEPFLPEPAASKPKDSSDQSGLAWDELNRLAGTGGSRATQALQAIEEVRDVRRIQAMERLAASGVFIGLTEFILHARSEIQQILQIDDSFRGPDDVLPLLQWIDQISYVRLRGEAIRQPVLEAIATMPAIKTIALVEGELDMAALRSLGALPRIQHLDFRYVPIDAEMVDYLATLPITISLTLNGTGAPVERVDALRQALPGLQVEFKQGGFLGVKCQDLARECVISEVVPDSGAEAAGLQASDVIVEVDGKPIGRFSDLQAAINAHVPGDRIQIDYRRGDEFRTTSAELGKLSAP